MVYLVLAVFGSVVIPIIMRFSKDKVTNEFGMYFCNYTVCIITGLVWMGEFKPLSYGESMKPVFVLGLITGVLYLFSLIYYDLCIKKAGLVLTSIFKKAAMIVPIIVAVVVFKNELKITQAVGILLSIFAIILINYEKKSFSKIDFLGILIINMLLGGFADSMKNVFNELCDQSLANYYVLYTFIIANICSIVMMIIKKNKIGKYELIYGAAFGVPNYFSAIFLTLALTKINPVIAYPAFFMLSMIGMTLSGVILFKEKLDLKKIIAILIVIVAMLILSI